MKLNAIACVWISAIAVILSVIGFVVVRPVLALVDASSSPIDAQSTSTAVSDTSTSIDVATKAATEATDATPTESASTENAPATVTPIEPPPVGLTEVHVIGT